MRGRKNIELTTLIVVEFDVLVARAGAGGVGSDL